MMLHTFVSTNIMDESAVYIVRVMVPLKQLYLSIRLQGILFQNTIIFIFTAVRILNPKCEIRILYFLCHSFQEL
jgi:hypothetical protein